MLETFQGEIIYIVYVMGFSIVTGLLINLIL